MGKISVVINTLNEEKNIVDCIKSVKSLADEIVVCDMHSEDKTVELAKQYGAKVFYYERIDHVEPARYYTISQTSYEWIVVLDADERMTKDLSDRLKNICSENKVDLVLVGVLFNYFGSYVKYGGFYSNTFPRIFRKSLYFKAYDKKEEKVHANFRNMEAKTKNKIQLPKDFYIIHEAYPTIQKYVHKTIGKYASLEANELHKQGEKFKLSKLILQPVKTFILLYFFKRGFLEGVRGLILCVLYSVFRFTVWANLWFLEQSKNKTNNE